MFDKGREERLSSCGDHDEEMSNVQNLFWGGGYCTVRVCASSLHTECRRTFLRMVSGFTASESWALVGRLWTLAERFLVSQIREILRTVRRQGTGARPV